jgi:predicted secreted protein
MGKGERRKRICKVNNDSTESRGSQYSGCHGMAICRGQNYRVSGLCASSGILNTRKHGVF